MEGNQSAYYGQYYIPLQNLEQEILQWLRKLVDAYAKQAGETPVEHIRSRIKTAEGMQEKLHKKGFETTADSALANVSDIVGFRLVTHFVGEVYDIVERMKQDGTFRIVKEKDYIANPKPNGYSASDFGSAELPAEREAGDESRGAASNDCDGLLGKPGA